MTGAFERVYFGHEPVYSSVLDAWFSAHGRRLSISDDRAGQRRWLTPEELARAEAERAQAEAEREQGLRQELERKLAALEAETRRK